MQSGVQLCGIIRGRDENKGAFGSRTMGCTLQAVTSLLSVYLHGHRPWGPESLEVFLSLLKTQVEWAIYINMHISQRGRLFINTIFVPPFNC